MNYQRRQLRNKSILSLTVDNYLMLLMGRMKKISNLIGLNYRQELVSVRVLSHPKLLLRNKEKRRIRITARSPSISSNTRKRQRVNKILLMRRTREIQTNHQVLC